MGGTGGSESDKTADALGRQGGGWKGSEEFGNGWKSSEELRGMTLEGVGGVGKSR